MTDDKRMNHDVMQRASERPITGAGATDVTAASGGLDVPGHEVQTSRDCADSHAREPIPGERERDTLMTSTPGIMGGTGYGGDGPEAGLTETMDEVTRREHAREGGGGKKGHRG